MKILITGGNGFIGSHLQALFENMQSQVYLCGQKQSSMQNYFKIDLLQSQNITDLVSTLKPTHIVHLAWLTTDDYLSNPQNQLWAASTIQLASEFVKYGGQHFLGVGTCLEYAQTLDYCNENNTKLNPQTQYGQAKLQASQQLASIFAESNTAYSWVRPFYVSGPGENLNRLIPSACLSFLKEKTFTLKYSKQIVDYLDVRDVATVLSNICLNKLSGIVNIASGQGVELGTVIQKLSVLINTEHLLVCNNISKCYPIIADITQLKTKYNFSPRFDLLDTLKDTLEYVKKVEIK